MCLGNNQTGSSDAVVVSVGSACTLFSSHQVPIWMAPKTGAKPQLAMTSEEVCKRQRKQGSVTLCVHFQEIQKGNKNALVSSTVPVIQDR